MIIKKKSELNKEKKEIKTQQKSSETTPQENVDLFDLDKIDFSQRQERRRGNRRRGYRRIDDRNLISRAQEEAGTIKDNAAREGYKAGIEEAKADIENLNTSIQNFMNAKQEIFEYIAPQILDISLDIARKIINKEVTQNPELILETISDVLNTVSKDETKVNIKVNPSQAGIIEEHINEILSNSGLDFKTNIISDDTIEEGGCIIQTKNGIVDASISTKIEIIKEAFKGMI